MTLTQAIKNNPYLKPSNLTDLNDVDFALNEILRLIKFYGSNKKLNSLYFKILLKREKLIDKNLSTQKKYHILSNVLGQF